MSTVGTAKGTVERSWVQAGGDTWTPSCGTTKPEPFRPLPDDCGVRQFKTKAAIVRAEMRRGNSTLDLVNKTVIPNASGSAIKALAVKVVAPAQYRTCETLARPELPDNFGLILRNSDTKALRNLKPGVEHRVERKWSGDCKDNLPPRVVCVFTIDMHVDIRRRS